MPEPGTLITEVRSPVAWPPCHARTPSVSVVITTYNHEPFIAQAVKSVLMQRFTGTFDVTVIDDCSTDGTRDILHELQSAAPGQVHLILADKNRCDNKATADVIQASAGVYVAMLDGDDHWTDPLKLQKQVDFLQQHPECAICFHDVAVFGPDNLRDPANYTGRRDRQFATVDELFTDNFIASCSVMLRKRCIPVLPDWYYTAAFGDWPLYVLTAEHGTIGYLDEVMAVYRYHGRGAWSRLSRIEQLQSVISFLKQMNRDLQRHRIPLRLSVSDKYYALALAYAQTGRHARAGWALFRGFLACPTNRRTSIRAVVKHMVSPGRGMAQPT